MVRLILAVILASLGIVAWYLQRSKPRRIEKLQAEIDRWQQIAANASTSAKAAKAYTHLELLREKLRRLRKG